MIRDRLLPGATAEGMVAGPIWQLASTVSPQVGPHWFNSSGGRTELLVWFAPSEGRDFGGRTFDVWSKQGQHVVFARESLRAGRPASFVTVLVPHDRGTDADAVARRITVESLSGGALRVTFGTTGETIDF